MMTLDLDGFFGIPWHIAGRFEMCLQMLVF
jgi:hypothetical protein